MIEHGIFDKNYRKLISLLLGSFIITVSLSFTQGFNCFSYEDIFQYNGGININVKTGDAFNITCCLQNNASCLSIKEKYNYSIPNLTVKSLNESAIQLTNPKAENGHYSFICNCGINGFLETNVYVGSAPEDVDNFECLVLDFLRMECTISTRPQNVLTNYKLFIEGSQIPRIKYNKVTKDKEEHVFILTEFQYNIGRRWYNFVLNLTNAIGTSSVKKSIDQYSIVKPQLRNADLTQISNVGVTLSWNILNSVAYKNYTNGLLCYISLKAEKFDFFINDFEIRNHDDHFWVEISNLYSFVQFRLFLRVMANSTADNNRRMWSEKFETHFTTLPSIPNQPPMISVGSFYIHPEENKISLFWRQMPEYEQNGPNFTYEISDIKENDHKINNLLPVMHKTSAMLKIDWKNTSQYEFKLKSLNQIGSSLEASVLKISPRYSNITHEEQISAITKVYHNQTYTVSWLKPINFTALSSLTLFWCTASTESKNLCTGPMDFKNLDRNALSFTSDKLNTNLNFALSENYYNDNYSSGMMWAMCSLNAETDLYRITLDNEMTLTENSILVQWVKECWHMAIIDGYIVTYCEVNTNNCIETKISKTSKNHKLSGLKPSCSYNITITPVLKINLGLGLGPISNPIVLKTENANNPTKVVIIACLSIFGIVAFIVLVYYSTKKISKMMKIEFILPFVYEDDVQIAERNVIGFEHRSSTSNGMLTENCREMVSSVNLTPCRLSKDILQPKQLTSTLNNYAQMDSQGQVCPLLATVSTPTDDQTKIDQDRKQLFAINCSGYIN